MKEKTSLKINHVAHVVAQQIALLCWCEYSGNFIGDGHLFCTTKNDVIYQAKLLPTVKKTALEIRNITQRWALSRPTIMIDEKYYQIDPNCSVVVKEFGVTSCGTVGLSESLSTSQPAISTIELVSVTGTGIMLLLVIVLIILLVCCAYRKKSKSSNKR